MDMPLFDPSLNIFARQHRRLDSLFFPRNVAVIGASERQGSVGRVLLWNLLRSPFGGMVFPVNPKHSTIMGMKTYPTIGSIPERIDLAVIATPAKTVPGIIRECVEAKVSCAIIVSAGFKELGKEGEALENEIATAAKRGNLRIVGPNCLGVMNPITGLNATFAADIALKGKIAFISQSGALCTAVLDLSLKEKIGFSSFVSVGSMMDLNWGDLIGYFGNDPNTHSILIYMESVGDPRSFLSAAREVALTKPIILIKSGRTKESAKAAISHTGALMGSDDVLDAALERVGVLRVNSISDLFSMAEILARQPRPLGPNLSIITNAGGPGVIATDSLIQNGGKLTPLNAETFTKLNETLPLAWSHNNPVDILGDASPDLYAKSVETVLQDPSTDGVLVILTPQYMTDPAGVAKKLRPFAHTKHKPILGSWMGAQAVEEGTKILNEAGIPNFSFPDNASKAFAYMWAYSNNLKIIYQTPHLEEEAVRSPQERHKVFSEFVTKAHEEKRILLTEWESKKILSLYNIPTIPTEIAATEEEAVAWAKKIGFPVVLKLHSSTITHKSVAGGVKLNLHGEEGVRKAFSEIFESIDKRLGKEHFHGVTIQPMIASVGFELILGASVDPEFGPVILFGAGGLFVEIFKDRALALPPLNSTLARRLMKKTKIYDALQGKMEGRPIDLLTLEKILVRFSNLIVENPSIKECDINPLFVSPNGALALDCRIVLYGKEEKLPTLAIRPYPIQYVQSWKLKDQTPVVIRPIRPEDEPLLEKFFHELSERSMMQRFLKAVHYDELTAHDRMLRFCCNDYDREIALIVEKTSEKGEKEILGGGRLSKIPGTSNANFSLVVKDRWQNKGIGSRLLQLLIQIAKDEKVEHIFAQMLSENQEMQSICKKVGFELIEQPDKTMVFARLDVH